MQPRLVSKPAKPLPPLACDAHAHVFGPYDRFPLAEERRYTPPLAPFEDYLAMLDRVGMTRGILVHAAANGFDCRGTLDALARAPERLRGIVVLPAATPDADLAAMDRSGARGVRFTETDASVAGSPAGTLNFADLVEWGPRLRALGWHAQIWANCRRFIAAAPALLRLGIPLVLDHMGYFKTAAGVADPDFQALLGLLGTGQIWVKLTAIRNSTRSPDYGDVRPFHDALLCAAPDRLLWGSDWPFIGLDAAPPDAGKLLDLFDRWVDDPALHEKILVDNPAALYGFET
jgi:predicted TIM-barrel fold metal-dependent hydrolase